MNRNPALGLLLLRLSVGGLMLFHGIAKLQHGVSGMAGMFESKGIPSFVAYGAYIGEVLAPIMLILGFRTRIGAVLLAFTMLVAVATAHAADVAQVSDTGGWAIELQALYCFGALALFFTGGGVYAVSRNSRWD